MAKEILVCKCERKDNSVYSECKCKSPNRKEWNYKQVIIQDE